MDYLDDVLVNRYLELPSRRAANISDDYVPIPGSHSSTESGTNLVRRLVREIEAVVFVQRHGIITIPNKLDRVASRGCETVTRDDYASVRRDVSTGIAIGDGTDIRLRAGGRPANRGRIGNIDRH
jgi:hypothetical protein